MKKVKILSLILALAVTTLCFTGCSGGVKDKDVTTIEMWGSDSHAKAVMNELVNDFNTTIGKQNKVKFVWTLKENGGTDELKIALQNGKEPDMFGCSSLAEFAENEYMVSLDDIPEIAETVAKNNVVRHEGSNVYDGKMYLMPISSQVFGLAYNKDMFKSAGIVDENGEAKPPETLAEFIEDAKILTDVSKQQFGIIVPGKWSGWFGVEVCNTSVGITGSLGYNYKNGEYDYNALKPMIEAIMQMKADGSIYPGMEGMDNDPARARFAEGNIGMKLAVSWDVGVWNDQFPAKCNWGIAPIPVEDTENKYYQLKNPSWSTCISKRNLEEKGADAVALVFNWLYSDENLSRLYKEGVYLPWRADIIENTEVTNAKVGWQDFGEIVKISKLLPLHKPSDTSGYDKINDDFMNKVWTGKVGVDEWIAQRNKISNDGIKLYAELHPDKNYSDRVYPDFEAEYKRN